MSPVTVRKIVEEVWRGPEVESETRDWTTLDQALEALDRLDGRTRTSLVFMAGEDSLLSIGGGDGRFVVFHAWKVDQALRTLIDPMKPSDCCERVVAGGQAGSYPAHQCVGKRLVARALDHFFLHADVAPDLVWLHEGAA